MKSTLSCVLIAALVSGRTFAQDSASENKLRAWVQALGDERPECREEATHALSEHLDVASDLLTEAALGRDAERASRARELLEKLRLVRSPRLAFTYGNGTIYDIRVLRLDSEKIDTLTDGSSFCSSPTWSPEGRRLAFARRPRHDDYHHHDLWVHDFATGRQAAITRGGDAWEPNWSPDGKKIVHVREREKQTAIWVMNPDGSGESRLTDWGEFCYPRFSPDGRRLLYTKGRSAPRLFCSDPDGRNPRILATEAEGVACWSPDSSKIALRTRNALLLVDVETGARTELAKEEVEPFANEPRFTPDGQRVACLVGGMFDTRFLTWTLKGKPDLTMETGNWDARDVILAPDGKRIYFTTYVLRGPSTKSGVVELYRRDMGGGRFARLTQGQVNVGELMLYPGRER